MASTTASGRSRCTKWPLPSTTVCVPRDERRATSAWSCRHVAPRRCSCSGASLMPNAESPAPAVSTANGTSPSGRSARSSSKLAGVVGHSRHGPRRRRGIAAAATRSVVAAEPREASDLGLHGLPPVAGRPEPGLEQNGRVAGSPARERQPSAADVRQLRGMLYHVTFSYPPSLRQRYAPGRRRAHRVIRVRAERELLLRPQDASCSRGCARRRASLASGGEEEHSTARSGRQL
jgi:hypothetical protein